MTQSVIWVVNGTQIKALVTFAYDLLMLEESFWQKNMVRSQCLNAFFTFLQITIWTSLQRRCHKKFWLIRGTKWGEVKVKEAQPPLQLLRRHNLHHIQLRAYSHHLSWVGGWNTDFILFTGIFNDISLGAECCFPFQILWPLFIFSSTQPTTFSCTIFLCTFVVFHSYLLPSCVPRSKFTYGMIPQRTSLIASFILWELQFQKSIPISILA